MMNTEPFKQYNSIHIVGIKGIAMASLAQSLIDLGKHVTGSDVDESFVTDHVLSTLKIPIYAGFSPEHLNSSIDLVIHSSAYNATKNVELMEAERLNIPTMPHAQALGFLMQGKRGISVCGVGGKSSTSAMITWILECVKTNPSFSVGVGGIVGMERTGRYVQDSPWYVAEADEYATIAGINPAPRFSYQYPEVIVCTNLAYDHPDVYASFEDTKKAYKAFFEHLPKESGLLITNGDDGPLQELAHSIVVKRKQQFSTAPMADISILSYEAFEGKTNTQLSIGGSTYTMTLQVPGMFNVKNACAALLAVLHVGISIEDALRALSLFRGTMRRFENKGVHDGIQYYDDYAHHPSEIRMTLAALREWYPGRRIIAVFEPHTYSRTKALLSAFGESFHDADAIYLADIFASAREAQDTTVSSDLIVDLLHKEGKEAVNGHTIEKIGEAIKQIRKPGDIIITIGAGDIYHLHTLLHA